MVANPVHLLGPLREAAQQTRAGQASEAYALFLFLRSKDFLAVGDSYAQPLADRVRVFARKRENVGQEGAGPSGCPDVPPVSLADSPSPPKAPRRARESFWCPTAAGSSSGSLAMLAAMRRASLRSVTLLTDRPYELWHSRGSTLYQPGGRAL